MEVTTKEHRLRKMHQIKTRNACVQALQRRLEVGDLDGVMDARTFDIVRSILRYVERTGYITSRQIGFAMRNGSWICYCGAPAVCHVGTLAFCAKHKQHARTERDTITRHFDRAQTMHDANWNDQHSRALMMHPTKLQRRRRTSTL